jgi:hypothetical protein
MFCFSKVLIHIKMKMRRLGKAKDVFIHFQPLISGRVQVPPVGLCTRKFSSATELIRRPGTSGVPRDDWRRWAASPAPSGDRVVGRLVAVSFPGAEVDEAR